MGFYATGSVCECRMRQRAVLTRTPAKTRVSGFRRHAASKSRLHHSQHPFPQRLIIPAPPKPASGVPYYGYRFYGPELGRWLNRDPIKEEGGLNLYGFVQNDPANSFDPLGESIWNWMSDWWNAFLDSCDFCGPDITDWLVAEMNRNASSEVVQALYNSRTSDRLRDKMARRLAWAALVRGGGPWDHKPYILDLLDNPQGRCPAEKCNRTITLCGMCLDFDVPSNTHYGYVGRRAGFSETELALAPIVVQPGGSIKDKVREEAVDTPAIAVGFDIFTQSAGGAATKESLCGAVMKRKDALKKEGVKEGCIPCPWKGDCGSHPVRM